MVEYQLAAPAAVKKEYGYRSGQLLVRWDADKSGDERWKWLVTDHLGSTRMEADKSGSLGGMRRHDYAPFGEEMYSGFRRNVGGQGQYGYEPPQSNVRQRFGNYWTLTYRIIFARSVCETTTPSYSEQRVYTRSPLLVLLRSEVR